MRILVFLAAAVLFAAPCTSASAQSAEHLALAGRYLELSQGDNLRQTMTAVMTEQLSKEDMPEEERRWFIEQFTSMFVGVMDQLMRDMRVEVARTFTEPELRAAIAFMETPEGRAVTQKQIELGVVMQTRLEPLLMQGMLGLLEKYCARFGCDAATGAALAK